ncbi:hypothetical protein PR048_000250 [Dryococelus australis]|uniref:Uncharacterized protein n=1 Tax=Dryococelus australis TaxID=614101 RepID=A0ABQ9IE40_9NEOP|nr:hypothetical protein PR048_000250 [Dryococelus australis]
MMEAKVNSTPCMPGDTLDDQVGDSSFDQDIYRQAIGCLLYKADISFAVGKLSKFCNNPAQGNCKNVKSVMGYIKYTSDLKLTYSGLRSGVEVFCGADWANDKNDSKSIGGYVVIMGGETVCWKSKKQQLVATSTVKAEYIDMFETCKEVEWANNFLGELNMTDVLQKPYVIRTDNLGACDLSKKREISERTKHFRIRYYKVKEYVDNGNIVFKYAKSSENVADIKTKELSATKTNESHGRMGLEGPFEI